MTQPAVPHLQNGAGPSAGPGPRCRGAVLAGVGAAIALLVVMTGCGSSRPSLGATQREPAHVTLSAVSPTPHPPSAIPGPHALRCTGTVGAVTVTEVQVPPGATCTLRGTTVSGNVSIGQEGSLTAFRVAVDGNADGQGARRVVVSAGSSIGGNVRLEQGGVATLSRALVRGNLQWTDQAGPLTVWQAEVTGDLQADQNGGRVTISDSRIGGDLQCRQNTRTPIQSADTVGGDREGQCAPVHRRQVAADGHAGPPSASRVHRDKPRNACAGDSMSDDRSDDQCGQD